MSVEVENSPPPAEDVLHPRVQTELEKLNLSSQEINTLELLLEDARRNFRQVLTDSTQQLNALAKKLGGCIEKARPYYEARIKAKEAQIEAQNAAQRFERACSQQSAAREMVNLAEIGFFKKGQPFDPAWQEMLNHATTKVNDAEQERILSEAEHQRTTSNFKELELQVKEFHRNLRRSVNKSRPYFENKAKFNQYLEDQKKHVGHLESAVLESKRRYSEALRSLEEISDTIHQQRQEASIRQEMGHRGAGVGAETPENPPNNDGFGLNYKQDGASNDKITHPLSIAHPLSQPTVPTSLPVTVQKRPQSIAVVPGISEDVVAGQQNDGEKARNIRCETKVTTELRTTGSESSETSGIQLSTVISPDAEEDVADSETTRRTNAEIMASLQAAKGRRLNAAGLFLRPNRSRDELDDMAGVNSDCESLSGSISGVSVIGDEQIECLMIETEEYVQYAKTAVQEEGAARTMPHRLSYLQEHITFTPQWVEEDTAKTPTNENQSINHQSKLSMASESHNTSQPKHHLVDGTAECSDKGVSKKTESPSSFPFVSSNEPDDTKHGAINMEQGSSDASRVSIVVCEEQVDLVNPSDETTAM